MSNRDLFYPLVLLIAGIALGAIAANVSNSPVLPIVASLAFVVIATLVVHVYGIATATENPEASKIVATRGRSAVVATGMVVVGIAVLLGTCAPSPRSGGSAFMLWIGWSVLVMGIVLTYSTGLVGRRSISAEVTLTRERKS